MFIALQISITVISAICGGLIFKKLKVPTPMLTGGITGVSVCTLIFPGFTYFPAELKTAVQIASGALIGGRVSRREIRELKSLIVPAILLVIGLMAFNLVAAAGMYISGINSIPTAIFSSAPGGMADMTIMAPDFGADPVYVAVIQFSRLLFVNIFFPSLIIYIDKRKLYPGPRREVCVHGDDSADTSEVKQAPLLVTAIAAISGGLLLKYLNIPAGAILGAAIFVAFETAAYDKIYIPSKLSYTVQIGIGCYVGVQMVRESLYIMQSVALPAIILIVSSLIYTYLCSLLIYRFSKFDFATCMLMCSPGGLNEMAIIADEMGADAPKVAVMHSIRLICIVAFFYRLITILEFFFS